MWPKTHCPEAPIKPIREYGTGNVYILTFCPWLKGVLFLYWELQLPLRTVVFSVLYCTSKITASLRLDCLLPSRNGLAVDLYCVNYKQKYSI